jgi:hypothetical protein
MTVPTIQSNRVGWEDGINFWGGSFVIDAGGVEIARAPTMEEHLLLAEIDREETRRRRISFPSLRDERPDLTHRELARILHRPEGRLYLGATARYLSLRWWRMTRWPRQTRGRAVHEPPLRIAVQAVLLDVVPDVRAELIAGGRAGAQALAQLA